MIHLDLNPGNRDQEVKMFRKKQHFEKFKNDIKDFVGQVLKTSNKDKDYEIHMLKDELEKEKLKCKE